MIAYSLNEFYLFNFLLTYLGSNAIIPSACISLRHLSILLLASWWHKTHCVAPMILLLLLQVWLWDQPETMVNHHYDADITKYQNINKALFSDLLYTFVVILWEEKKMIPSWSIGMEQ